MSSAVTYPLSFRRGLKILILLVFILGNMINLDAGWADNGDFTRIMNQYSSGPIGMENWPASGTPENYARFFHYFLPYFELNYPSQPDMFISAQVLWLPGVLLNQFFFSPVVLWMPLLSLGARFALFTFLWVLLTALEQKTRCPELFFLTLGLPLALLFSTTSVVAYFNTFYQETGAIVFLPILLFVVAQAQLVPRKAGFYVLYALCLLLATTSKTSLFYLPILTLPFVLSWRQLRANPAVFIPLTLALLGLPMIASLQLTKVPMDGPMREYNSLINGVLALSEQPENQLASLGVPGATECLDKDVYSAEGLACYQKYRSTGLWNYRNVVKVMLAEPQIILRQFETLTNHVQNLSNHNGRYIQDDPVEMRRVVRLDFWAVLQKNFFPRGWALLIFTLVSAAILFWSGRKNQLSRAAAVIGWVSLACFWVDMFVQILGDGQRDLTKHLFVASLVFNFWLLATVNAPLFELDQKLALRLKSKDPSERGLAQ